MVGAIDVDTLLELCRDRHRRIVLATLVEERRSLTVSDLTKTILKHNHQIPTTEISGEDFRPIQRSLHHLHLPKLTSAGVVEYDIERGVVTPTEAFDELEPHLSAVLEADSELDLPLEL